MSEIIKIPHYEIRCSSCGCHFKFKLEDIVNERYGAYKEYISQDFVICPNCRKGIEVRDNNDKLLSRVKVKY